LPLSSLALAYAVNTPFVSRSIHHLSIFFPLSFSTILLLIFVRPFTGLTVYKERDIRNETYWLLIMTRGMITDIVDGMF